MKHGNISSFLGRNMDVIIDGSNMDEYPEVPVRQRVGKGFEQWKKEYEAPYHSYKDFMNSIE